MLRVSIKKLVGLLCMGVIAISASVFAAEPNVLLIVVDDMEGRAPGIFGGVFADDVTPNIDHLATEGMRFERAHVAVAVCQPSRQTIMTGKYSLNIGALGFTPIASDITTLGQLLDQAGYINGIFHKLYHLEPVSQYEWSYKKNGGRCSNGKSVERAREMAEEFIDDADATGKPFFFMANTSDPHAPFYGTQDEYEDGDGVDPYLPLAEGGLGYSHPTKIYTEADVTLPGFLKDSGIILEEVTQYVNSCRRADDMVGALLDVIDEKGKRNDTIVIFLSDNGMPFPSAKHNTYFQSTKTPLIIRWPGHVAPNTLNATDYVSGIDLMPTILEAAGISIPSDLDGSSMLPLLGGATKLPERSKVVTTHYEQVAYVKEGTTTWDMFLRQGYVKYNTSQLTRPKDLRCIQSDDYGYIFNAKDTGFSAWGPEMTLEAMAGLNDDEWWAYREAYLDDRGPEEFYDFQTDPYGLDNLINNPAYAGHIAEFRAAMLAWMEDINDPQQLEFEKIINNEPLETYLGFANLSDGQNIASGSDFLSEIEAKYVFANYPKSMILQVNGNNYDGVRVRAPFKYDLSGLSDGVYELRLRLLDHRDTWTTSSPITVTIGGVIDTEAPVPNPSAWVSTTATDTTITMTAETATDPSGVFYYFQWRKGTDAWTGSGWVTDPSFTATGLVADSEYTLYVRAQDGVMPEPNMGSWSTPIKVRTSSGVDTLPPTPNPSEWVSANAVSATAIEMQAVTAEDPSGVEYSFYGLKDGVSAFWSGWISESTYTAMDLDPATEYSISVRTRDGLGNGGNWSSSEVVTTLPDVDTDAPTPNPSEWASASAVSATAIEMQAVTAEDPSGVEYSFFGQVDGVVAFWSGWVNESSYTKTGLEPGTTYTLWIQTRDGQGNVGGWSSAEVVTTM